MRYLIFLLLTAVFSMPLFSQHFEWASSGGSLITGYQTGCMRPDGHLIAAGQYQQPYFDPTGGEPEIYSASGSDYKLFGSATQTFVTCYSPKGEVAWVLNGEQLGVGSHLLGVTALPDNKVVVAFTSYQYRRGFTRVENTSGSVPNDDNEEAEEDGPEKYVLFAVVNPSGDIGTTYGVAGLEKGEWSGFGRTSDGGYIITYADNRRITETSGKRRDVAFNFTVKLGKDFKMLWEHKVKHLDESCCSYFTESVAFTPGPDGDVFITGSSHFGAHADGDKEHMAPVLDVVSQYNEPYESYVARISREGKLKWIRFTGGKSLINSISSDGTQVIIGGKIMLHKDFMGMQVDTTDQKKAFMVSLGLDGKPRWIKTFNAVTINALSMDESGNIFASFDSKRTKFDPPLVIGTDSLVDSYKNVVVACFDNKGNYRWYKSSNVSLSSPSYTKLYNDHCGNLFITGEMWYVLPINMSLFDAAIVRGRGYGGAPLAAKIRTTIPEELLAINVPEPLDTNKHEEPSCVPIPYPWKLLLFPNPTDGHFTVRATLSYADKAVQLELWDTRGGFIRQLMAPEMKTAGSFDVECAISDLATGTYVVVLRGTGGAVTAKIMLSK